MPNAYLDLVGTPMLIATGTNSLVVGTNGAGSLVLLQNAAQKLKVDSSGVLFSKRLREALTPTDVDAQNNTLTVAQIVAGIVVHTSVTGGGTVTTDTAENIVAGDSGHGALAADGESILCYYINDGDQTLTLAGGTGVTIADTGQTIATNESAILLFRRTSSTAVTCYILGA